MWDQINVFVVIAAVKTAACATRGVDDAPSTPPHSPQERSRCQSIANLLSRQPPPVAHVAIDFDLTAGVSCWCGFGAGVLYGSRLSNVTGLCGCPGPGKVFLLVGCGMCVGCVRGLCACRWLDRDSVRWVQ